jgi:hypothetical protein
MYRQIRDSITNEISTTVIKRELDNAFIPVCDKNIDYQDYISWISLGNSILSPEE